MSKIDELKKKIESATGKERVDLLNDLAYKLNTSSPIDSEKYVDEALEMARKLNYRIGEASSLVNNGWLQMLKASYTTAIKCFQEAVVIFESENNNKETARALLIIARCYGGYEDYNSALEYFLKARDILDITGDKRAIAFLESDTSYIYWKLGNSDSAMKHLYKALEMNESIDNISGVAATLSNIGMLYAEKKDYDKALEYYNKSIQYRIDKGDPNKADIAATYDNICENYLNQGEYKKAIEFGELSLKLASSVEKKETIIIANGLLGKVYIATKKLSKAHYHLDAALKVALEIKSRSKEMGCYQALAELAEIEEKYKDANNYLKKFFSLKEQVTAEEKKLSISKLQAEFDIKSAHRDAEIHRLKNVELAKEINVRKKVEVELKIHQDQLEELVEERTQKLTEKNFALKQVLEHLEEQRTTDRIQILKDIDKAIFPFLDILKVNVNENFKIKVDNFEIAISSILGKDLDEFTINYATLTSRESEICKLVRKGLTSKEIAEELNLTLLSTYRYRSRIREKLDITNKDIDLATYLRTYQI